MAWQLSAEVAAYLQSDASGDLTPAEGMVLWAIAEKADEATRTAFDGDSWKLSRAIKVGSDAGLRRVFQRLASRGLEVRVQRGVDGRGYPMFAHRGAQLTYRLPRLVSTSTEGGTGVPPSGTGVPPSGTGVPPSGTGVPPSGTGVPPSGTGVPPYPSLPTSPTNPSSPPSPRPAPEPQPPADTEQSTTETLVDEYRQYGRMPSALIPKLAERIAELLRDGYSEAEVRSGLELLRDRGGQPGRLPWLVQSLVSPPKADPPRQGRQPLSLYRNPPGRDDDPFAGLEIVTSSNSVNWTPEAS